MITVGEVKAASAERALTVSMPVHSPEYPNHMSI